jgi:hypothetical protein
LTFAVNCCNLLLQILAVLLEPGRRIVETLLMLVTVATLLAVLVFLCYCHEVICLDRGRRPDWLLLPIYYWAISERQRELQEIADTVTKQAQCDQYRVKVFNWSWVFLRSVGTSRSTRVFLVSRRFAEKMSDEEMAFVFAHECGHLQIVFSADCSALEIEKGCDAFAARLVGKEAGLKAMETTVRLTGSFQKMFVLAPMEKRISALSSL